MLSYFMYLDVIFRIALDPMRKDVDSCETQFRCWLRDFKENFVRYENRIITHLYTNLILNRNS